MVGGFLAGVRGLFLRQSSQGSEDAGIVQGVDQAQFGEAIEKCAFGLDDGGVGGTAGLLQVSKDCANRKEQVAIVCDHGKLRLRARLKACTGITI
jgi:hypothetical protein